MGSLEEARELFYKDRYAVLSGIEIDEVGSDHVRCSMKLTEAHRNAYGGIMGGAIYTLADFAFAVASNYCKERPTVSLTGQASFLSASKGSILYADTRLIKDGRRNCFYEVVVSDDTGRDIASVCFTGAHIER
ncbi:MAG TPA: phenylacetic acid degradation protein [Lachnospiraceae bacterium]|nr:phenylacetic acid degradation protein [Lachnospiraceae bacterium]